MTNEETETLSQVNCAKLLATTSEYKTSFVTTEGI